MSANPLSYTLTLTAPALALANHLWQSTLVAGVAALLTLTLRRNHARARYCLWFAASVKFLVPFSLLMILGGQLASLRHATPPKQATAESFVAIDQFSQPFSDAQNLYADPHPTTPAIKSFSERLAVLWNRSPLFPLALAATWLIGFVLVTARWTLRWRRISAAIQLTKPLDEGREFEILQRMRSLAGLQRSIELRSLPASMEPGIFGLFRPVLLWPQAITERLEDTHLEAVLAHEVCHVRRRDNLTAALHMLVEACSGSTRLSGGWRHASSPNARTPATKRFSGSADTAASTPKAFSKSASSASKLHSPASPESPAPTSSAASCKS